VVGVKRGKVTNITANDWSGWSGRSGWWGAWGGAGGGLSQNSTQSGGGAAEVVDSTLSLGQISVSASVNVSFMIE
jgi:hypothetical protein